MFGKPDALGQALHQDIHCEGMHSVAVTFLVNCTASRASDEKIVVKVKSGVQYCVQLVGAAKAVVKGVGVQLEEQEAANSLCPAPQSLPPDIISVSFDQAKNKAFEE